MEVDRLQQYLPFTVLKHDKKALIVKISSALLQQYLPFTVLKLSQLIILTKDPRLPCCNSTYRLRY